MGLYQHTPYVPYTFRHLVRFTYHKNTYEYGVKIVKMHSVIIMMVVWNLEVRKKVVQVAISSKDSRTLYTCREILSELWDLRFSWQQLYVHGSESM